MTELNIEYPPRTQNPSFDLWMDRLTEYLRKYLSQPFDRGDPSGVDFAVGSLTTDGDWHDLDLSSIVPEDTVAVILSVGISDDAASSLIQFRKNGNSNAINVQVLMTQVTNVPNYGNFIVFCDSSRVIEYLASNTTFTAINITVSGWFK